MMQFGWVGDRWYWNKVFGENRRYCSSDRQIQALTSTTSVSFKTGRTAVGVSCFSRGTMEMPITISRSVQMIRQNNEY